MISVVVCTCNRPEELRRCLDSLRRQTRRADEIVVVCSGSDRTGASVCADYPEAVVVRIGEDNVSLARDAGIEASRGEQLFFFDDDAEPEPCFLEAMSPLLALPGTGGVGGMVLTPSGACEFRNGVIDRLGRQIPVRRSDEPLPAGFLPTVKGCGCGFRREALAAVGNFDPNFVFSFDEADVALSMTDRGWRIRHSETASVIHHSAAGVYRSRGITEKNWRVELCSHTCFVLKHAAGPGGRRRGLVRVRLRICKTALRLAGAFLRGECTFLRWLRLLSELPAGLRDGLRRSVPAAGMDRMKN